MPRVEGRVPEVIIELVVAEYFGTNCWIFAPSKGSECFLVDPGMAVPNLVPQILEVLDRHNLKPIATVITHGHLDHTFSVLPLDEKYGLQTYIHSKDRQFLAEPQGLLTMSGPTTAYLAEMGINSFESFADPSQVTELKDGTVLEIAGFTLEARHAPGHTPGSTVFKVDGEYLISGDVLFRNSIGNSNQRLGDEAAMKRTLREVILPMDDHLIVLPGHGAQTTIGEERRNSQFLTQRYLRSDV